MPSSPGGRGELNLIRKVNPITGEIARPANREVLDALRSRGGAIWLRHGEVEARVQKLNATGPGSKGFKVLWAHDSD